MILLARPTPLAEVRRRSEVLSLFLVDLKAALAKGLTVRPIANMVGHETSALFLDGLNAERAPIAADRWFIDKAAAYAKERIVFDRPIGRNQGVQFPLARAHIDLEAADLMRFQACARFDAGLDCGAEAKMAKLLAADVSWEAANVCLQTHGGFGFAVDFDVERKFRETRLYQVAPVSTNLILAYVAEHVLGLPRSC
jgi:acyl-CoA dehydrogenase